MEHTTFVLFGATGDLAKRKIYPALYNLFLDGKLPETFSLVGMGRRVWTDEFFQANVSESLKQFSRREANNSAQIQSFVQSFRYSVLDVGRKEDYEKLRLLIEQREAELQMAPNRLFYLSVGPEFFETIAANIKESGLGSADGWKRLVIEKPFGRDLKSARELNEHLNRTFSENEIFRIDHYLGKPMVQKLESLQQANPVIKAIWSNRYIANVQISAIESVGVEERAGYYDHTGAIRDMFQNHMLQLLMMIAMHLPYNSSSEQVRFKKKKVMEALEPLQKDLLAASVIRGQYTEGHLNGKQVAGYTFEPGIEATSLNDTFIAARLQIDSGDWCGVPFYIRTGKRLKEKATRIVVEFKDPIKAAPASEEQLSQPNLLVIEINPNESITLHLNEKDSDHKAFVPMTIELNNHNDQGNSPEAYENLIRDAIDGDPTFFAHWDEVELAWEWVQPILEAFEENAVPLHYYKAGTYGPAAAAELLAKDGFHWWLDDTDEEAANHNLKHEGEQYAHAIN